MPRPETSLGRRTARWRRRGMVGWYSPGLLPVLFKIGAAKLFGEYDDRRERLQAIPPDGPVDYRDEPGLWLDYVADLGDGFDPTATVASLLAADRLDVDGETLRHGRVLVMGGDQVYPAASRDEYLDRLEVPYYSLHPRSPDDDPRDLYAIPGNHDWYDGLASFARLFMQGRWFAGWKTRQSRSYFALRLPGRWWFIGIDLQLDNDIDQAQLLWLEDATRGKMQAGDRVILATSVPYWLESGEEGERARRNVAYVEKRIVRASGGEVHLAVSGDLHHYQRHESRDGRQYVVAGGGGAFTHGTAWQPETVVAHDGTNATRRACYPSPGQSRRELWRLFLFPLLNPGFAGLLACVLGLLLWGADSASNGTLFAMLGDGSLAATVVLLQTTAWSPALFLATVAWFGVFAATADPPDDWPSGLRDMAGVAAGSLVAAAMLGAAIVAFCFVSPSRLDEPAMFLGRLFLAALLAGLLAAWLYGIALWIFYQLAGFQRDRVFAACRLVRYKNFLRLHIAADGTLTLHALGVDQACTRWRDRQRTGEESACVEPATPVVVRRIDRVVIVPGTGKEIA